MDKNIKNTLGITAALALLSVGYAAISFVSNYSKSIEPSSFRSFAVSGEGRAVGIPDVARFTFSVITEGGKDVASLQEENTGKVNKAIAFVKSNGVDKKDVRTENYNLQPRYQYFDCRPIAIQGNIQPCPPPQIVGYSITQGVAVTARDFRKVGDMLAGVVKNGANQVSAPNFTIDDPTSVQNEARAEAIAKAKNKAEAMARAGGFSLGRLLSIEEGGSVPVSMFGPRRLDMMEASAAKSVAPMLEPGSQEVSAIITLKYEIE